jgi:drug/metabolite transporter (DMT)-like permease
LVLLGAIWGSSFLFMRIAVPALGSAPLAGIRIALAALMLSAIAVVSRQKTPWATHWKHYLFLGAINTAIPFSLFAYAARSLPASLLSLFNSLAPVFASIAAALWLGTPISRRAAVGLFCGFGGVALLAAEHLQNGSAEAGSGSLGWALAAAFAAPLCYGVAATYIKKNLPASEPLANAHGSLWMATLVAAPLALGALPSQLPAAADWAAAVTLGLLCTGAAYLLYFQLLSDLGPTRAPTVTFLIPIFGVLWGALFLHEALTLYLFGGGALILLGMYLVVFQ